MNSHHVTFDQQLNTKVDRHPPEGLMEVIFSKIFSYTYFIMKNQNLNMKKNKLLELLR